MSRCFTLKDIGALAIVAADLVTAVKSSRCTAPRFEDGPEVSTFAFCRHYETNPVKWCQPCQIREGLSVERSRAKARLLRAIRSYQRSRKVAP